MHRCNQGSLIRRCRALFGSRTRWCFRAGRCQCSNFRDEIWLLLLLSLLLWCCCCGVVVVVLLLPLPLPLLPLLFLLLLLLLHFVVFVMVAVVVVIRQPRMAAPEHWWLTSVAVPSIDVWRRRASVSSGGHNLDMQWHERKWVWEQSHLREAPADVVPCCPLPSMICLVQEAEKNLQITRMGNPRMVQVRSHLDLKPVVWICGVKFVPWIDWLRKFESMLIWSVYTVLCQHDSLSWLGCIDFECTIMTNHARDVMYVGFFRLD